jgi:site-specific DNA recombinase
MKKAIAYYKVSSNNQNKKPSVESQQINCGEYAKNNGYMIVKKVLGDSNNETQAIAELLSLVEEKKVDYVIAEHPDRISRDQSIFFWLKNKLSKLGVKLRFADIDVNESPAGVLMEGIFNAVNDFDNELRSRQIKKGIRQAA